MTDAPPPPPVPANSSAPAAPAAPADPGKTMGIVALVLSILPFQLIGIILGFVALGQSKRAGQKNGFAVAAIIVGMVLMALSVIAIITIIVAAVVGGVALFNEACAELGAGVWEANGGTITCP